MTLASRLIGFLLKLPPVESRKIKVEEDIKIVTNDGINLLTDHYFPKKAKNAPVIIVRTPYSRKSFFGLLYGRLVAERGYHVLIQSCRGTFGSGGEFFPYKFEQIDGLVTVKWMKQQEWFSGSFATLGGSYMGFTQWAIAMNHDPELKTISPTITASEFHNMAYPNGSFSFQSRLDWVAGISTQEKSSRFQRINNSKLLQEAYNYLPLVEIPEKFLGQKIPYWNLFLDQQKNQTFWEDIGIQKYIANLKLPICMVTGWFDIFLPWQLNDYQNLCEHGNQPYLTIGPWSHSQFAGLGAELRESLQWINKFFKNQSNNYRTKPVKIFIQGANIWREFEQFPLPNIKIQEFYLRNEGKLSISGAIDSPPDDYDYDPKDPTPNVGGTLLRSGAGPQNNVKLESRKDVLTYSSEPLDNDLEIIGQVSVDLFVSSSLEYTDFFARLCNVDKKGKSINICDGIVRLSPQRSNFEKNKITNITINLWPTAYQFKIGNRIRLQVSSGAHPRFVRNLGTGDPLATAIEMKIAHQMIYHDSTHPSCLKISVYR